MLWYHLGGLQLTQQTIYAKALWSYHSKHVYKFLQSVFFSLAGRVTSSAATSVCVSSSLSSVRGDVFRRTTPDSVAWFVGDVVTLTSAGDCSVEVTSESTSRLDELGVSVDSRSRNTVKKLQYVVVCFCLSQSCWRPLLVFTHFY